MECNYQTVDISSLLLQRLNSNFTPTANNKSSFDPYQMMINRKNNISTNIPDQSYTDNDVLELENYCKKMGIVGINNRHIHPKALLNMLKQKMGDCNSIGESNIDKNKQLLLG